MLKNPQAEGQTPHYRRRQNPHNPCQSEDGVKFLPDSKSSDQNDPEQRGNIQKTSATSGSV